MWDFGLAITAGGMGLLWQGDLEKDLLNYSIPLFGGLIIWSLASFFKEKN